MLTQTTNRPRRHPKQALGKLDNSEFKRQSALTAALILKRLGVKKSTSALTKQIQTNCAHLRFLGRKMYRKFQITKKIKKSGKKQRGFSKKYISFVLRKLLACSTVAKSPVAYQLKNALKNANKAKKSSKIVKSALKLAKAFKGPKINPKKKKAKNVPKKAKKGKKSKKGKKGKKVKKALKQLKKSKKLKKKLVKAQKKCRKNGFKSKSKACKKAKKLGKTYRKKAKKIRKVIGKSCKKLKKLCFRINLNCKQMFNLTHLSAHAYCILTVKCTDGK